MLVSLGQSSLLYLFYWGFTAIPNTSAVLRFTSSLWEEGSDEPRRIPAADLLRVCSAQWVPSPASDADWKQLWDHSQSVARARLRAQDSGTRDPSSSSFPTRNDWQKEPWKIPTEQREQPHRQLEQLPTTPPSPVLSRTPSPSPLAGDPSAPDLIGSPVPVPDSPIIQPQVEARSSHPDGKAIQETAKEILASLRAKHRKQKASRKDKGKRKLDMQSDEPDGNRSLVSKPKKRRTGNLSYRKSLNSPSTIYCSHTNGHIHLLFHKEQCASFDQRIRAKQLKVNRSPMMERHATLPIGLIPVTGTVLRRGRISRILCVASPDGGPQLTQGHRVLLIHYKYLIAWIYPIHEALMNKSNLPTFVQKFQHQKLVDWIDELILMPDLENPVLIGIVTPALSLPSWKNHQFDETRSKLIHYFAQAEHYNHLVPEMAAYMVDTYQAAHKSEYLASTYPRIDDSTEIYTSTDFDKIMVSLFKMLDQETSYTIEKYFYPGTRRPGWLADPLNFGDEYIYLTAFNKQFEHDCDKRHVGKLGQQHTIHPKLPIAMYFLHDQEGEGLVRILDEDKYLVTLLVICRLHVKLIKSIHYFHTKIIEHLKTGKKEPAHNEDDLLNWLSSVIIKPKPGNFPLIGPMKINGKLAPWEDVTNKAFNSLKPIHLQLIKFFSEGDTRDNLEETSAFVVTTWYQEFHPIDFARLLE
ncbi:hypothetical protein MJO28_001355 [Puccinia striiformis f. sp. tritici]|uniref:Uncharacterized protein n=1 Tax=Puccinia striiformis f. sp. tritici TaxID=168172 RepID=A0ACC0ETR1_9BASI|nr:hypothetical protein MJO28_001355 [Puccinia striiformis f. sp. tritici]KAI7965618.1 hypothetical protein MJO29_001366 [Puccinia striiformis f. sp. tritici]